ncbi:MAG TPA: hypothetical protein PLP57_01475 [Candidatus Saccharicenans sp.]|jgi:hypothetical protein|nr:hypothetical protein [Candidatus Saccharicenans sp.]HRD01296.1 hypothetical protein [Candidatus Saccharicenans sp.]
MGKYNGLYQFLKNLPPEITERTLTFEEIENILGDELPPSAFKHRQWWPTVFNHIVRLRPGWTQAGR